MAKSNGSARRRLPTSPFSNEETPKDRLDLTDGDRVTHDKHGMGRVVRIEDSACVVSFGEEVYRRITLSDPRLTKL